VRIHNLRPLFAVLSLVTIRAASTVSAPKTAADMRDGKPLVALTSWRICGPFKLPEADQAAYTNVGAERALAEDYLAKLGGTEVPFKLGSPTTKRAVNFDRDPADEPSASKNALVAYFDQIINFPLPSVNSYTIFRRPAEFYKIMYAATDLVSQEDADAVLIMGSNSPVKIWLNDQVLATSRPSTIGHDQDVRYVLPIRLKRGSNPLLVKMFCFPQRNEFSVRVGTRKSAQAFVEDRAGLRDLVEQVVVREGKPFLLSENLKFFSDPGSKGRFEFVRAGEVVKVADVDLAKQSELATNGLASGLYKLRVKLTRAEYAENVYIGDANQSYATYEEACGKFEAISSTIVEPCAALSALKEISIPDGPKFNFRLDWQKRALLYAAALDWNLRNSQRPAIPVQERIGTRLIAYRSSVDGQIQHYFLHLPKNYDGVHPVPLVIHCPHNTRHKPFLTGPTAFDVDWINKLAALSDELGFACLWPNARGQHGDAPVAVTDTMEVLNLAEKQEKIDADRIYLTGDCEGAAFALDLAQTYPDRFAALGIMNGMSVPKRLPTEYWKAANSPYVLAENLKNMPVQLIHGELFPHSPSWQSTKFKELLEKVGIQAKLILLPGDTRWADQDPFRLSFEFFKGKARPEVPTEVTFVTGQAKHDSAYWVRVKSLTEAGQIARVEAKFVPPNHIEAKTENVGELELFPEMLAKAGMTGTSLSVALNGTNREVPLDGKSVVLEIAPQKPAKVHKNHDIEGPVSHAFAGPFILVGNSGGSAEELKLENAVLDAMAKHWEETFFVPCRRKLDKEITDADIRDNNLIFAGTPQTNTLLKRVGGQIPLRVEPARLQVGDASYDGKDLSATIVYPNPLNPRRYIVVTESNNFASFVLPQPNPARMCWYDVAVWRSGPGRVFLKWAGYWDNTWTRLLTDPAAVIKGE
jgi:predicted esterase